MGKYFNFYFLGGIKVYKNSNFFHKNKGTVLLLALFVLFFTSAIIGIIYSYNSRIFKLAMEEKRITLIFITHLEKLILICIWLN